MGLTEPSPCARPPLAKTAFSAAKDPEGNGIFPAREAGWRGFCPSAAKGVQKP